MDIKPKPGKATLVRNSEIARNTPELVFRVEDTDFNFVPGQYIWLMLPSLLSPDPHGNRRAFSIASAPAKLPEFSIIFRKSATNYKKTLSALPVGAQVEFFGPFGSFTLPPENKKPLVFIAGGVAVAPFISILEDLVEKKKPCRVTIFTANRSEEDAPYGAKLRDMAAKNPNIILHEIKGKIDVPSLKTQVSDPGGSQWYVVGTEPMVDDVTDKLIKEGIKPEQFHFDEFYGYPTASSTSFNLDKKIKEIPENDIFKMAVENSSDQIVITDVSGRIRYANPAAERITGFSRSEILGNTPRYWGGMMGTDFYKELWKTIKTKQKPFYATITNRRKNNELYTSIVRLAPIMTEERGLVGFVSTEEDISDIEKAKEALEHSEARYRALVENGWDVVLLVGSDGKISYESQSIERVLGYTIAERVGRNVFDLVIEEDKESARKIFDELLIKPGATLEIQVRLRHKDGSVIWVQAVGTNLLDNPAVKAIVINFRDITRAKQIDEEKTEFMSMAAHQLRTPLGGMRWNVEMLLAGDRGELSQEVRETIQKVYDDDLRLITLVDDLLDVSRIEKMSFKSQLTQLTEIIEKVIAHERPSAERKGLSITFDHPKEELPKTMIDPERFFEIIDNLVTNAIKYTTKPGAEIKIAISEADDHLVISVTDNGIGIPEKEKGQMFTKFFRGEKASIVEPTGTGLGLFVVKSFIESWGGRVWMTSKESEGTTVTLEIPIKNPS